MDERWVARPNKSVGLHWQSVNRSSRIVLLVLGAVREYSANADRVSRTDRSIELNCVYPQRLALIVTAAAPDGPGFSGHSVPRAWSTKQVDAAAT